MKKLTKAQRRSRETCSALLEKYPGMEVPKWVAKRLDKLGIDPSLYTVNSKLKKGPRK